jgi:putative acyl-CoA dehydrogenase
VLRATSKSSIALDAVYREIRRADGMDARLDAFVNSIAPLTEANARSVVGSLAVALQASLLLRRSAPCVADAFCASRLSGGPRADYGTLPEGLDLTAIIQRGMPKAG